MTRKAIVYFLVVFATLSCQSQKIGSEANASPYVILKLDDLWNEDEVVHPGWVQVVDFLRKEKVVGSIGIVGESLENGKPEYFEWIRRQAQEGFEFWNHGYCHCKPSVNGEEMREFRGTDLAFQLENLNETQRLASEKLGMTLRSFGAPYNATDANTLEALATIPELKVWMYKETAGDTEKLVLKRIKKVNIEYPVHVPNFQQFKEGYEQHEDENLLVLQGHPRSWVEDAERFKNFQQIIRFLKSKKVRFITPYDYYQAQATNKANS